MSANSTDHQDGLQARELPLATLRGVCQVEFQNNVWTALLFLLALLLGGWRFAVFALIGALVTTVTAWVLGVARDRLTIGLEGFNGTLIGVAVALFFEMGWVALMLVIAASVLGAVVTAALTVLLAPYDVPALTAPFCVVTSLMMIGGPAFARIWDARLPPAPATAEPTAALSYTDVWQGLLNGIGQVFFQDKWYAGLVFLIGLLVASRVAAIAAVAGSAIGIVVAVILGAPATDIGAGLYGYNSVLTAIALAGVFVALTPYGVLYAVLGAVASVFVTAGVAALFRPVGGPALTWPFVLVTWTFLAAVPMFSKIRRPS
ncbi:urea transporter [Spongiactinospora gelatinilytica]|uniref:urea transporter n=1 Tax=Spongiactinospora gelatinilytica TaxID=2666298 RepID=UPI001F3FC3AC|nr:urea transporter [Spongiactinospora gelatinilytica]